MDTKLARVYASGQIDVHRLHVGRQKLAIRVEMISTEIVDTCHTCITIISPRETRLLHNSI